MAITERQAMASQQIGGTNERQRDERQENDMEMQTTSTAATRFILQARPTLLAGLRVVPVAMLLIGAASAAAPAGATGCVQAANVAVSGGTVSNQTTVDLSADGGEAFADAEGGNNNTATGGAGGAGGDGGDANAGNGGIAVAEANGGMIDLDDINSGDNAGNTIVASVGSAGCGSGARNLTIDGGRVSNETTVRLSADGGTAVANAQGGNNNTATGGAGGAGGDGGDANAGNGGVAVAEANGGAITVGNINSGNNRGNSIVARLGGWFGRASNVRISGGTVSNETTVRISADGGTAVANAQGGNNNTATGGAGGAGGDGGDAAAGNGGVAVAEANGGAVTVGNINSGGNSGNTIVVQGGQSGNVNVDGGTVTNETTIDISADGGTAVANAEGGNNNTATGGAGGAGGDGGDANAGNGGVAQAEANGGSITVGDINSGDNEGNTIIVGG
jgi:hypothetical protein